MKEIKAVIQPFMLTKVIGALKERADFPGLTVSEVKGFGKTRAEGAEDTVVDEGVLYARKVKLEMVVPDHLVDHVVGLIESNARTGRPGDGKIFVIPVDDVVRIRTGERGEEAV